MSPVANFGHVYREDQRFETQGFCPLDQLFVQLPVSLHVELEPPEASWGSSDNVLKGTAGICAGDVAGAGCLGSCKANDTTQVGGPRRPGLG